MDIEHDGHGTPRSSGGAAVAAEGAGALGRRGIDQRRILVAAVEFIDECGLRALTMRALGARLGVEAMSLYYYVPGKESLLDGVVETVIDDLYGDPHVHMQTSNGWQDYLQRLAHGVRRIALAHPQVFPLIASRPPAAPWVRPPLRSLRWMENFLDNLIGCGFDDAAAVAAYRAFSSFLLGHLLLEVSAQGVDTGPVEEADPGTPESAGLQGYPQLSRLKPELRQDHSEEEFEQSLESLLDRLEATLHQ